MKYIDGFDTANAHATTPDGYKLVAHYSTGTKFTAFTMKVGCGAACIRAYDEFGGIADFAIPGACRTRSRGENDSARDGETGDGNVL